MISFIFVYICITRRCRFEEKSLSLHRKFANTNMKISMKILTYLPFSLSLMALTTIGNAETLISPDGQVKLNFELNAAGQPTYSLIYHGKDVIKPSHLGFTLRERKQYKFNEMAPADWAKGTVSDFSKGFVSLKSETSTFDETWQTVWGEEAEIRNHYNQFTVLLEQQATTCSSPVRIVTLPTGIWALPLPMATRHASRSISLSQVPSTRQPSMPMT